LGEGIHEGTVVKWHVREGDMVKADQVLAEVETDKAVVELPSPFSGKMLRINFTEGMVVKVGEVLLVIGESGEAVPAPQVQPDAQKSEAQAHVFAGAPQVSGSMQPIPTHHLAAPSTRKLARELGVDIDRVQGSGPGGRIMDEDVRKAAPASMEKTPAGVGKPGAILPQAAPSSRPPGAPTIIYEEGDERIPLTHLRKIIAERMVYSKTHIPHACGMDIADVTKLVEVREKEKKNFEPKGIKLTYLPFIVKAVAIALREYPKFNAHFDEEIGELIIRKKHNIGIAVDTPEGLMVPVVKDVDKKSIIEIARDIEHLADMARQRKLKLDEIRGGTFTITNVGSVGGMFSSPIINPPEVAIMGVHRIKDMPLALNDKVKVRKAMGISMCFDHRVADGAEATLFMNVVMKHLEDPGLMLVDMI
jgi:pyruvate dehydrogenase E2 component (dihydrolipoamide acetyltransferase)